MYDKIAVISDRNSRTAPLESSDKALLYQKAASGWQLSREIGWLAAEEECRMTEKGGRPGSAEADRTASAGGEPGIPEMRSRIRKLIDELGDCRIIVSGKLAGIPYHIFDKMGFHIFETGDPPSQELFQYIIREIEEAEAKAQASRASAAAASVSALTPVSPDHNGNYYLNLIELQQAHPEISSKKALRQFMEETVFGRLELICNHIPPWMEAMIASKSYDCQIEKIDGQACKVTLSNPYYQA